MKNRKLILIVSLVLAMTMSLGGTLAYLQDTDADVNTMVLGNVSIKQHEFERVPDGNGGYEKDDNGYKLQDFTQEKPLLPIVGDPFDGYDPVVVPLAQLGHNSRGTSSVLPEPNVQDKFVVVENDGNTDAYVRTYVAFEAGSVAEEDWYELVSYSAHFTWKETQDWFIAEINGNNYYMVEYVYNGYADVQHPNGKLKAGDYAYPSLQQVYVFSHATNEDLVKLDGNGNGTFDILVLSQAIQADGFADAVTALNEGFGEFNEANVKAWFEGNEEINNAELPATKIVASASELEAALNTVTTGTTIVLDSDIYEDVTAVQAIDHAVLIDGKGHEFGGIITINGKSAAIETAGLVIKDVNFVGGTDTDDAYIKLGVSGDTSTRYVNGVTISNCTFEGDGIVAVKSYTGGDKNVTIENCYVGKGMHSLAQLKNVAGLTIRNCVVEAARGVSLNNTAAATIEGCTFDVQKYAVRFGESANTTAESFLIKNTTLKSQNVDDDAVIVFRAGHTDAELTLENVTIEGEIQITGNEKAPIIK